MPVCFQLIPKGSNEPEKLQTIDQKICEFLGVPVDEKKWCGDWYNVVGFRLAIGKTFAEIREEIQGYVLLQENDFLEEDKQMLLIIDFLDINYESNSFRENRY